jgi:transposase
MSSFILAKRVISDKKRGRYLAWKVQCRLCARYRALLRNGKGKNVAITAVARELAGFIWAVHREVTSGGSALK